MFTKKSSSLVLGSLLLLTSFSTTTLSAQTMQQKQTKPFLIQGKLPHLTMMVKQMWNDEDLALAKEQKAKLLEIRKETIKALKTLKPEVTQLEAKIVTAVQSGEDPKNLEADVQKLAQLKAKATMIHLNCIYKTRKILTKEQRDILE
ncbi:MAG: hypothetical protein ABGW85_01940 [Sulfurimonas sp.]